MQSSSANIYLREKVPGSFARRHGFLLAHIIAVIALALSCVGNSSVMAQSAYSFYNPSDPPYRIVRKLQILQTAAADGRRGAVQEQRQFLAKVNRHFFGLPKSVWTEPVNSWALVVFTLSGGHPRVARSFLSSGEPIGIPRAIIEGAIAYVEGRRANALSLLEPFDIMSLPPTVGAQLALVMASLVQPGDPARSLAYLDRARLLMPGTLVDEAALRRTLYVTAQLKQFHLFVESSKRYLRRFPDSAFIFDFIRRLAIGFREFDHIVALNELNKIKNILNLMDETLRRDLSLLLSRSRLVAGELRGARYFAELILSNTPQESPEQSRAKLYMAGTLLDAAKLQEAFELYWAVDITFLDSRDKRLRQAIGMALNNIRQWPQDQTRSAAHLNEGLLGNGEAELPPDPAWALGILGKGRMELNRADQIIYRAQNGRERIPG